MSTDLAPIGDLYLYITGPDGSTSNTGCPAGLADCCLAGLVDVDGAENSFFLTTNSKSKLSYYVKVNSNTQIKTFDSTLFANVW